MGKSGSLQHSGVCAAAVRSSSDEFCGAGEEELHADAQNRGAPEACSSKGLRPPEERIQGTQGN